MEALASLERSGRGGPFDVVSSEPHPAAYSCAEKLTPANSLSDGSPVQIQDECSSLQGEPDMHVVWWRRRPPSSLGRDSTGRGHGLALLFELDGPPPDRFLGEAGVLLGSGAPDQDAVGGCGAHMGLGAARDRGGVGVADPSVVAGGIGHRVSSLDQDAATSGVAADVSPASEPTHLAYGDPDERRRLGSSDELGFWGGAPVAGEVLSGRSGDAVRRHRRQR